MEGLCKVSNIFKVNSIDVLGERGIPRTFVKRNVRGPIKAAFRGVRTWSNLWSLSLSRTRSASRGGLGSLVPSFQYVEDRFECIRGRGWRSPAGVLWIRCCLSLMSNRRLNTNISFGKLLIINAIIIRREVGELEELF